MKRLTFVIITALALSFNSYSQESKGNFTFDINFNPAALFDGYAGPMFNLPSIKGRYFVASDMAVRLGLDLGIGGQTTYPGETTSDYNESSSISWTLSPGIEKQIGSEKFFVYFGADLPISGMSSSSKSVIGDVTVETKNQSGGYISFGVNGVLGADYYVFPNLYVGAEFAPGFAYTKTKDRETDGEVDQLGGKQYNFNLGSTSGVRIGFRF